MVVVNGIQSKAELEDLQLCKTLTTKPTFSNTPINKWGLL